MHLRELMGQAVQKRNEALKAAETQEQQRREFNRRFGSELTRLATFDIDDHGPLARIVSDDSIWTIRLLLQAEKLEQYSVICRLQGCKFEARKIIDFLPKKQTFHGNDDHPKAADELLVAMNELEEDMINRKADDEFPF